MTMKRTIPRRAWVGLLALCLSGLALAGCNDNDSKKDNPPANQLPAAININGVWDTVMTQPNDDPAWNWHVPVTIVQTGQSVQGSFRAGTAQTLTGTYVDGTMTATDSLDCLWQINFSENLGTGTRTRRDIPVTTIRMTR